MKKIEGFIFDVDGTLASTNDLIFASFNHVAEKYLNKKLSNEEIIALFGPTEDVILKDWMNENYDEARKDYFDFYETQHHLMADVFPGIKEALSIVKEKNVPLGIFTGKGRDSANITLKAIGVLDHFDLVITGDDVADHKPSPEGIFKFINTFGLNAGNILMIGDSVFDVTAAKEAGVKSCLVLWDNYAMEKYSNVKADYIFTSVEKFITFLKTIV